MARSIQWSAETFDWQQCEAPKQPKEHVSWRSRYGHQRRTVVRSQYSRRKLQATSQFHFFNDVFKMISNHSVTCCFNMLRVVAHIFSLGTENHFPLIQSRCPGDWMSGVQVSRFQSATLDAALTPSILFVHCVLWQMVLVIDLRWCGLS